MIQEDEGFGWIHLPFGKHVHVLPLNDTKEHEVGGDTCWCDPEVDDGVMIHNAADEREDFERGLRKVS